MLFLLDLQQESNEEKYIFIVCCSSLEKNMISKATPDSWEIINLCNWFVFLTFLALHEHLSSNERKL